MDIDPIGLFKEEDQGIRRELIDERSNISNNFQGPVQDTEIVFYLMHRGQVNLENDGFINSDDPTGLTPPLIHVNDSNDSTSGSSESFNDISE